jgi:hypothetical protein
MPASSITRPRRRLALAGLVLVAAVVVGGCLPAQPSSGRATPLRRVLVLGDSMTYGLYGTTPRLDEPLGRRLMERNIYLTIDGFPGEDPVDVWPGHPRWADRLRSDIDSLDPDMVVIQSILFLGASDPARREAYSAAVTELFDIAQSRGAHVYIVSHQLPTDPVARDEMTVAESLQAQAAAGRGISTIPLDWWLARCASPFVSDGWHLSANGQECHATAITEAVDQLRKTTG